MDPQLVSTIASGGAAAAVIVTVGYFLAYLREERAQRILDQTHCHEAHSAVVAEAAAGLREASAGLRECARSHGLIAQALDRCERASAQASIDALRRS